jgi:hypothetical protein
MGFYHEDRIIYLAAPFLKKTFPLLRINQYSSLAALAFQTGHAYWGWRFTGLALHYVQDLTQPYHSSLSPGNNSVRLIAINLLAMAGFPRLKDEMIVLLSNRHLALEKYQSQVILHAAQMRRETLVENALRNGDQDAGYPAWSDLYARDVVSRQSHALGSSVTGILLDTLPAAFVTDPSFDFGVNESKIDLLAELNRGDKDKPAATMQRNRLDQILGQLLGNFAAHSRNTVRGILKAAGTN